MSFRLVLLLLATVATVATVEAGESRWPGFRNHGDSHTRAENLPLHWSDDEGLAWRKPLAGFGQSSPVIYGGTVWITSTGGERKERLFLEAFDLGTGERRWQREFAATQTAPEVSEMISRGAPTPAVDADAVYAFFESGDLFALDHAGNPLWQRCLVDEFGPFRGGHGIGSSPVQSDDHLFLLVDHDGPSYLLALDKGTGETRWKVDREPRVSWTSPLFFEHEGEKRIAVSSNGRVDVYDAADGTPVWHVAGIDGNNVPSPTKTGDLLLIGSSAPTASGALRLGGPSLGGASLGGPSLGGARQFAWKADSVTSSFGSPLAHDGMAFFVNRAGALQANSLEDGSRLWETRLPASTWASPVSDGERIWCFCTNGETVVLRPTPEGPGEPVARNSLAVADSDRVYGVAMVDGRIVLRTAEEVIAIGEGR